MYPVYWFFHLLKNISTFKIYRSLTQICSSLNSSGKQRNSVVSLHRGSRKSITINLINDFITERTQMIFLMLTAVISITAFFIGLSLQDKQEYGSVESNSRIFIPQKEGSGQAEEQMDRLYAWNQPAQPVDLYSLPDHPCGQITTIGIHRSMPLRWPKHFPPSQAVHAIVHNHFSML
jgi:hypothetical protein